MKKIMSMSLSAAAMLASVTLATAQMQSTEGMYMDESSSGDMMIFGPDNTEGSPVMMGAGDNPSDCPDGSYYENSQHQIMACGNDSGMFEMMKPAEGTMMPSGQPWSSKAMMLEYRENKM